tara:strand:- start:975 stop:1877 length:903 start_codon:yes stop_codon:yes gene_type:complete
MMVEISNILTKNKIDFVVFTSERHLKSNISSNINLKKYFDKKGIKYFKLIKINDLHEIKYKKYFNKGVIGLSLSSDHIFTQKEINLFDSKLYNIHASNLPDMRGAGGFTWNILMQKFTGGVTLHKISKKIDEGDIILQKKYVFPKNTRNSLKKMKKFSISLENKMVKEFVKMILNKKKMKSKKQSNKLSISWGKLNTYKDAWIDWNWDVKDILIFIQAFSKPYCGASTIIANKRVFISKATILKTKLRFHPFQYGMIFKIDNKSLYVACNNGILKISDYKIAAPKKKINYFLNKKFINKN